MPWVVTYTLVSLRTHDKPAGAEASARRCIKGGKEKPIWGREIYAGQGENKERQDRQTKQAQGAMAMEANRGSAGQG
jgi:hypothetical protein